MKIRSIKVYQSVNFEKSVHTYFSSETIPSKPAVELSMQDKLQCVEVKSKNDHVLIPLTNIAAIYLWNEVTNEKEARKAIEAKKLSTGGEKDLKRPR